MEGGLKGRQHVLLRTAIMGNVTSTLLRVKEPTQRQRDAELLGPCTQVVYDPVHAVYHDHWEDHIAMPGGRASMMDHVNSNL